MNSFPPTGLVLLAILAIQLGAASATFLFPVLGASGTVAIRIIFSAIILGAFSYKRLSTFGMMFLQHWKILSGFGLCLASLNFFFFEAIARIPLGIVVAIEFIGPLGVAAYNSKQASHFGWIALAAFGIILLSPLSGVEIDALGVVFALLAGTACAMLVAALVMLPFFIPVTSILINNPIYLLAGFGIALLSTTLPFTLEFNALKRLPARNYGVLVSLEPGVAAFIGALLLGERLGIQGITAIICVTIAAIGITLSNDNTKHPQL